MIGIFSSRNADSPVGNESRHHIELLDGIIDKWNHWFVQIREKKCCWCNPQIFFHIPLPTMILPILPHQTLPRSSGASHPAVRKASLNGAWSPHSVSFTAMGAMGGELEDPCPVGSVGYGSKTSYSLAMSSWCLWMFIPRFI